jgi:hypothetical protein
MHSFVTAHILGDGLKDISVDLSAGNRLPPVSELSYLTKQMPRTIFVATETRAQ